MTKQIAKFIGAVICTVLFAMLFALYLGIEQNLAIALAAIASLIVMKD